MDNPPMQCAWCLRLFNADAVLNPPLPELVVDASHGMCPECHANLLARRSALLASAGDLVGAVRCQRRRLRVLLGLNRRGNTDAIE